MRLHEEIIKQAILHPEKDVRSEAILYFSRSYTDDDSVLPLAVEAVEQYGWDEAFSVASCMTGLPLNDATLPWVLAQLQHENAKKLDPYGWSARWHTLNSLLSNADAELLARHKRAILDIEPLEDEVVEIVAERIDLLSVDADICWRDLEQFCEEAKDVEDIGEVDLEHAHALVEAIGRQRNRCAEQILSILAEKIEDLESNPKVWMETFAVRMAGEMRLEPAIPLVIDKLKEGGEEAEWLTNQCEFALAKIGGDGVIQAAAEMYRQGDWHLRMAACNVLQHVHSDLAVSTALEFLLNEEDGTIRAFLGAGLASHLAFEAIEPLRQLVLDGTYDETYADLKRDVVVAAMLMNVELSEMDQWKSEVRKKQQELERRRLEERSQSLQQEINRLKSEERRLKRENQLLRQHIEEEQYEDEEPPRQKIGRNDPCPCGSGKKFKKCCLRNQNGNDFN